MATNLLPANPRNKYTQNMIINYSIAFLCCLAMATIVQAGHPQKPLPGPGHGHDRSHHGGRHGGDGSCYGDECSDYCAFNGYDSGFCKQSVSKCYCCDEGTEY